MIILSNQALKTTRSSSFLWHLNPLNALKQIIHYSQIQNKIARSAKCIPNISNLKKSLSFYNYLGLIRKPPSSCPATVWSSRSLCPFAISQKNKWSIMNKWYLIEVWYTVSYHGYFRLLFLLTSKQKSTCSSFVSWAYELLEEKKWFWFIFF